HEAVWDRLDSREMVRGVAPGAASEQAPIGAASCETCGLVSVPRPDDPRCPRCDAPLHARKPESLTRTWTLVIAAAVLYVPANYFPVLTVVQLGAGSPSTILGGVSELLES